MMLLMMMMDLMMGTDNLDILKIQVVERSTEVVQLGPPLNFKFNDVFVFRLILKTAFLVFFLFSAAQDNITEVVAELSSISCFFSFSCFYFLLFACFVNCFLPVQEYLMEGTVPDEKWAVWTELVQVLGITKIILLIAIMKRVRA